MTAKTVLVQLHHKIQTFEHINRHLVLVVQDRLLEYMRSEFSFGHLQNPARLGDPMHLHAYHLEELNKEYRLALFERVSTDTAGIAKCLGLQGSANVDLTKIVQTLDRKLSDKTLITI